MSKTHLSASCTVTTQFYDVDPMNVVWHGNYPRFLEEARCALLDLIGYNYKEMKSSGYLWPIVDMRIKYVRPLLLHQKLLVEAILVEYENRLKIEYKIRDAKSGDVLSKAYTIQVAVNAETNEMEYESPSHLVDQVEKAQG